MLELKARQEHLIIAPESFDSSATRVRSALSTWHAAFGSPPLRSPLPSGVVLNLVGEVALQQTTFDQHDMDLRTSVSVAAER